MNRSSAPAGWSFRGFRHAQRQAHPLTSAVERGTVGEVLVTLECPRCGLEARPPGLWSDTFTCQVHGSVAPLHPAVNVSDEAVRQVGQWAQVPLWLPWPLPMGWLASGMRYAGDEHSGPVAAVLAFSGPNPLPDGHGEDLSADLLLVAEQPGVGLGAHLAGLDDIDPGGAGVGIGAPHLKVAAGGHDCPLWSIPVDGGMAAYVGEASGVWLWAMVWPETAAAVLLEQFELRDLRDIGFLLELPGGALSPRLTRVLEL